MVKCHGQSGLQNIMNYGGGMGREQMYFTNIFMPLDQMIRGILFLSCLSLCLSIVNFNIRYNFWTIKNTDFILAMHTSLIMPFQMTLSSITFDLDLYA